MRKMTEKALDKLMGKLNVMLQNGSTREEVEAVLTGAGFQKSQTKGYKVDRETLKMTGETITIWKHESDPNMMLAEDHSWFGEDIAVER